MNFTFGGFKAGDSRNNSIGLQEEYGTPQYDGWQILESKQENGKIYVTKIIHAGSPENFVNYYAEKYDSYRAEYILSDGIRLTELGTLSNGTKLNSRNWDMYKDEKQLDLIKDVHIMTTSEYNDSIAKTGAYYWLASVFNPWGLWSVTSWGQGWNQVSSACFGVRPVVSLKSGVYIEKGTGTEEDKYILKME